jgi:dCTP diphosphatase
MGDEETSAGQTAPSDLLALRDRMRLFTAERDWSGFHDPKSVLLALVGEVGELAELFQWLPAADAVKHGRAEPLHTRAGEEISDVLLYLVLLADVLDIDLAAAANAKLTQAALRYPAPSGRAPSGPATGLAEHGSC